MKKSKSNIEKSSKESSIELEPIAEVLNHRFEPQSESIFERSEEEQRVWDEIKQILETDYKLTSDGTAVGRLSNFGLRIEEGFNFVQFFNEVNEDVFSPLHIEPLIDQAADLLDRGINDREKWDELASKMFLLAMELHEFAELDDIHQREEQKGIYDVQRLQSNSELAVIKQNLVSNLDLQQQNIDYTNILYSETRKKDYKSDVFNLLELSEKVPQIEWVNPNPNGGNPYQRVKLWDRPEWSSTNSKLYSERISQYSLAQSESALNLQLKALVSEKPIIEERKEGITAKADWDAANSDFMKERTKVARKYEDIKAKAATQMDGLLNYGKRLDSLKERFHQDFRYALERLSVIQLGLQNVYGFTEHLSEHNNSINFYDDCLLWTRKAINFLVKFSRTEQNIVLPISLKSILTDKEWQKGLIKGYWEIDLAKKEKKEFLFAEMSHVRLRGLSAFVISSDFENKLWQLNVQAPKFGTFYHNSGETVEDFDQTNVPPCKLGRVSDRNTQREPDIVGMSALFNASPIGSWNVQILRSIPITKSYAEITDIHLDLHLAFRSQTDNLGGENE